MLTNGGMQSLVFSRLWTYCHLEEASILSIASVLAQRTKYCSGYCECSGSRISIAFNLWALGVCGWRSGGSGGVVPIAAATDAVAH